MRKSYKITLGVLTVMILLTLTIGTSYSYYSVGGVQDQDNVLVTRCFKIKYTEGSPSIKITNAYPMSPDIGKSKDPFNFTIENTCQGPDDAIRFDITLNKVNDANELNLDYINYYITGTSTSDSSHNITKEGGLTSHYTIADFVKEYNAGAYTENVDFDNSYSLQLEGTLAPGEKMTYNLNLWINEGACNDNDSCENLMGKVFKGRLLVYAYI